MSDEIATRDTPIGVPLFIDVTEQPSGGLQLVIAGEVDLCTGPQLQAELAEAVRRGECVELDMSGVTFIDSTGLSVLIDVRNELEAGQSVVVTDASPAVIRLFDVTGLGSLFGVAGRD